MTTSLILVIIFASYSYDLDLDSETTGLNNLADHSSYHYEFTRALACGGGFNAYDSELIASVSQACDSSDFKGDWGGKGSPFVHVRGTDQNKIAELLSYHYPRRGSRDIFGQLYPGNPSWNCRSKKKLDPPTLGQILSVPCDEQPELLAIEKWALNGSKLEIYSFKNQKYLNVFYATCTEAIPGALSMFTCGLVALMCAHRKKKRCSMFCVIVGLCALIAGFTFFAITIFGRHESPLIQIDNGNWSYIKPHSLPAFGIYLHSLSDSYSHQASICDGGYIGHHIHGPTESTYLWHKHYEWGNASVNKGVPYTQFSGYAMWNAIKTRIKQEKYQNKRWSDTEAELFINKFVSLPDPRDRRRLTVDIFLDCVNNTIDIPDDPETVYVHYSSPSQYEEFIFCPWINNNAYILGAIYGSWVFLLIFLVIWEMRARRHQMERDIEYHYSVHDTRRPRSLAPHSASKMSTGRNSRLVSREACGELAPAFSGGGGDYYK